MNDDWKSIIAVGVAVFLACSGICSCHYMMNSGIAKRTQADMEKVESAK